MIRVNALKIRNQFGAVLELLDKEREPILIEKRKEIRAVLISYEDFKTRFIDKQAEEEKRIFLNQIKSHTAPSKVDLDPLETLRTMRGYSE